MEHFSVTQNTNTRFRIWNYLFLEMVSIEFSCFRLFSIFFLFYVTIPGLFFSPRQSKGMWYVYFAYTHKHTNTHRISILWNFWIFIFHSWNRSLYFRFSRLLNDIKVIHPKIEIIFVCLSIEIKFRYKFQYYSHLLFRFRILLFTFLDGILTVVKPHFLLVNSINSIFKCLKNICKHHLIWSIYRLLCNIMHIKSMDYVFMLFSKHLFS